MARDPAAAPIDPGTGRPPPTRAVLVAAFAIIAGTLLYEFAVLIGKDYSASFFCIPGAVGFIVGLSSLRRPYRWTLYTYLFCLALLLVTFKEGAACLAMSAPFTLTLAAFGAFAGHVLRRFVRARRARAAAAALLVLALGIWQAVATANDDPTEHPLARVSASLPTHASPAAVFALLTDPSGLELGGGDWPRILAVGLPIPRRLTVTTPGLDGRVRLDFNHGSAVARITAWMPGQRFAFVTETYALADPPFFKTRLGSGPYFGLAQEHVTDWLTFTELAYDITPLPDGGATLSRSTEFRRHLFPGFYFGTLEERVIAAGTTRLLEKLRDRLDGAGAAASASPPPDHAILGKNSL